MIYLMIAQKAPGTFPVFPVIPPGLILRNVFFRIFDIFRYIFQSLKNQTMIMTFAKMYANKNLSMLNHCSYYYVTCL